MAAGTRHTLQPADLAIYCARDVPIGPKRTPQPTRHMAVGSRPTPQHPELAIWQQVQQARSGEREGEGGRVDLC